MHTPKNYINVNCLQKDGNIDIASLYYCTKCHIDLKQPGVSDCPCNSLNSNSLNSKCMGFSPKDAEYPSLYTSPMHTQVYISRQCIFLA